MATAECSIPLLAGLSLTVIDKTTAASNEAMSLLENCVLELYLQCFTVNLRIVISQTRFTNDTFLPAGITVLVTC